MNYQLCGASSFDVFSVCDTNSLIMVSCAQLAHKQYYSTFFTLYNFDLNQLCQPCMLVASSTHYTFVLTKTNMDFYQ
jgi:hypothetical protein